MSVSAVSSGTTATTQARAQQVNDAPSTSCSSPSGTTPAPTGGGRAPGEALKELNQQTPALRAQLAANPVDPKAGPAVAGDPKGEPPVLTQADMAGIRKTYQVSDDPGGMTKWKPSGFTGWLAEKFGGNPKPVQVTASEAKMLDDLGPGGLKAMSDIKQDSFAEAEKRFPSQATIKGNDDQTDAFRHAYWSAQMSRQFGSSFAQDYGNAHERVPGNTPNREAMDLHNNEVGRRIARENPFATDAQLGDLIEQAVRDGKMVVLDRNGQLVPSNAVGPAQTGHEPQNAPAAPGHDPEQARS